MPRWPPALAQLPPGAQPAAEGGAAAGESRPHRLHRRRYEDGRGLRLWGGGEHPLLAPFVGAAVKAWCSRWVGIAQRMCSEPPGRSSGCSSRPEFCSLGLRLGNWGCAFLQIEVGRSSWPLDRPYLTLVPSVALMTPADSKLDRNRCGVRMFKEGKGKPFRSKRPSGEVVWGCPIAMCPPPPPQRPHSRLPGAGSGTEVGPPAAHLQPTLPSPRAVRALLYPRENTTGPRAVPPCSGRLMWGHSSFSSPAAVGSVEQTSGCCLIL